MRGSLQETRAKDLPPSWGLESRKGTLEQELGTPPPLYLSPQPGNAAQDATQHRLPSSGRSPHLAPMTAAAPGSKAAWVPHLVLSSSRPRQSSQLGKRGLRPTGSHLPRPHRPGPEPRGEPLPRAASAAPLGSAGGILKSRAKGAAPARERAARGGAAPAPLPVRLWAGGSSASTSALDQLYSRRPGLPPGVWPPAPEIAARCLQPFSIAKP